MNKLELKQIIKEEYQKILIESKMQSAAEIVDQYDWENSSIDIPEILIDFAIGHVKEALRKASIIAKSYKTEILNCYPIDNIK